jgi:tetratricopeptide (TPR) repeat protein/SAM-dependent methyltransferase
LTEAAALYQDVLARAPGHAEATHYLGVCLVRLGRGAEGLPLVARSAQLAPRNAEYRQNFGAMLLEAGDPAGAERAYSEAIALDPAIVAAHNGVGMARQRLGRYDGAIAAFREALRLAPGDAGAANNLGNCLSERGDLRGALDCYRRAVASAPHHPMAHNNLGNALQAHGELGAAVESYRRAIEADPQFPLAHHNLALVLRDLGEGYRALEAIRRAVRLAPDYRPAWQLFAELFAMGRFKRWHPELGADCLQLLAQPDVEIDAVARAVFSLLLVDPQFGPAFRELQSGNRAAEDLFKGAPLAALTHPLFLALIENAHIADPIVEAFLTRLRQNALRGVRGDAPPPLPLACALAQQCFFNEYLWPETADETRMVAALEAQVRSGAQAAGPLEIALLAAYRPLARFEGLAKPAGGGAFDALWRRQVEEPRIEAGLRAAIPALTGVEDATSRMVQQHYEENPYPRWQRAPSNVAFPLPLMLRSIFPHLDPARLAAPDAPEILIAGCGTGCHAATTASLQPLARVLAVDISRASLAYAMRRCRELGLQNIRFAQADILRLGSLDERFDLIECSGVLHHLREPLAGWRVLLGLLKPGGFMKVGLYSEVARRNIVAAREALAALGAGADLEGIRAARQFIFSLPEGHAASTVANTLDFYSASGARDLVLHGQEHRFTIDSLGEAIAALGVEFLGFEFTDRRPLGAYRRRYPEDPAATDFARWRVFEQENPDTFVGMYQFWVKKP